MVVHSLVRRGVEMASDHFSKNPDQPDIQVSSWLLALCAFTSLAFVLAMWSVDYSYGSVVATLAAVEDTNPDLYVRLDADYDPSKPDSIDPIARDVDGAPKPITSKLRTTIAHLRARAGRWSRFRGFAMYMAYGIARGSLFMILPVGSDQFSGQFAIQTVLAVLLANLQMAWVHIVVSKPSNKRFYQRIPGFKSWVQIAPVAAFENIVVGLAFFLPLLMAKALGGWDAAMEDASSTAPPTKAFCKMWAMTMIPSILSYLVSIPAQAVFVRVAASMLPEEDEAIVPFDRSFGGKVVPAILGGSGRLSIMDAWRTFDRPARVRYLKVIGKVLMMEGALMVTFTLALLAQFSLMGVETMQKLIAHSRSA